MRCGPSCRPGGRATIGGGVPDIGRAQRLVATLADPPTGECDVDALGARFDDSFARGTPADALTDLEAALQGGATAGQAERLRALASPLSGG